MSSPQGDQTMTDPPNDQPTDSQTMYQPTDQPTPEQNPVSSISPNGNIDLTYPTDPGNSSELAATSGNNTVRAMSPSEASSSVQVGQERPPVKHVHKATGYTWEKEEDAPGYAWKNKKAQEESARALEAIVDKDKIIGRKYGDIGLEQFPGGPPKG